MPATPREILGRIARSVKRSEAGRQYVAAGRPSLDGSLAVEDFGQVSQWVRVTSSSPDGNGHFTGKWLQFNADDNTLTDEIDIFVREVRGGKLKETDTAGNTVYYRAWYEGDYSDGTGVWVPLEALSSDSPVTGTTDYGTSSSAGTSPPGVLSLPTLTVAGPPSWTPAANTYPLEWDSADDKLYAWDGSDWIDLSAGTSSGGALFVQTASVTVSNTNSTTTLTGTGQGSLTLPANQFTAGSFIEVEGWGTYADTGSAPTFTWALSVGSVTVQPTASVTLTGTNITTGVWHFKATVTCRTTGGSGSIVGEGTWEGVAQPKGSTFLPGTSGGAQSIDTTTTNAVDLTVTMGTADPSNTVVCEQLTLRFVPTP